MDLFPFVPLSFPREFICSRTLEFISGWAYPSSSILPRAPSLVSAQAFLSPSHQFIPPSDSQSIKIHYRRFPQKECSSLVLFYSILSVVFFITIISVLPASRNFPIGCVLRVALIELERYTLFLWKLFPMSVLHGTLFLIGKTYPPPL